MKLSNTFKIIWWALLLFLTGGLFLWRLLNNNLSAPVDVFIFLILVMLLLLPLLAEIEFFGIKFKKEIEELKEVLKIHFGDLKNDIRMSQSQVFNSSVSLTGLPTKEDLKESIKVLYEEIKPKNKEFNNEAIVSINVPVDDILLFKIRYTIEGELRRLYNSNVMPSDKESKINTWHFAVKKIIQDLLDHKVLKADVSEILRQTFSICNYAVHGEQISAEQREFVKQNADDIIKYLKQIN